MMTPIQAEEKALSLHQALATHPQVLRSSAQVLYLYALTDGKKEVHSYRVQVGVGCLTLSLIVEFLGLVKEHLGDFYEPRVHVTSTMLEFFLGIRDAIPNRSAQDR